MTDNDETFGIKIVGASKLRRAMKEAGVDAADLKDANQQVAATVLRATTPPRRTGRLAGSGRASRSTARARVTYSKPYAAPIHWGWPRRNIPANPWLSEAAQRTEPYWTRIYLDALTRIVERVQKEGQS